MSWQLLTSISVITYSVSVLLQRAFLKNSRVNPIAFSILFQLITGLLILGVAIMKGFEVPNLSPILLNLILMIIFYGLGNIFIFKSLQLIEASQFTILTATRSIWSILAATLFLRESISIRQILGTFLIISSVALVSYAKNNVKLNKGIVFALLASLSFGFGFANDAYILKTFDTNSYTAIAFIIPALIVWLLNPKVTSSIRILAYKPFVFKLLLVSFCYAISAICIYTAFSYGGTASSIAPLNQMSTIVTVILAVIFLHEKNNPVKKMVGAGLSFIGALLVI